MEDKIKKYTDTINNAINLAENAKFFHQEETIFKFPHIRSIVKNIDYTKEIQFDTVILLNSIANSNETNYLQCGIGRGTKFISAMHCNKPASAYAIDDFGGDSYASDILNQFIANKYFVELPEFKFIKQNCLNLLENDKTNIKNINLFYHSGSHNYSTQRKIIPYYYDCLDDIFIFITCGWHLESTKHGTEQSIEECSLQLLNRWIYNNFFIGLFKK